MADQSIDNSRPTQAKIERISDLLQELKDEATKAHNEGDTFVFAVYNHLIKVCSPIIQQASARLDREEKAVLAKKEKALRKKDKAARDQLKNAEQENS